MGYSTFRATGTTHHDPKRAFQGFTVFSNIGGDTTYVMDMSGEVVHRWKAPKGARTLYAEVLESGNLLGLYITENIIRQGGAGVAVEFDWDGNVVWTYEDAALHHDFCVLENGHRVFIAWKRMSQELTKSVRGGTGPDAPEGMLGDVLREVDEHGKMVREWPLFEALEPAVDVMCPLHKREEWTHCNGVGLAPNGDLLVTFRATDTIATLSRETGKFTWRWGRGVIGHPHDGKFLPNGNVLVFDNGWHQVGVLERSRLLEVDPRTNEVVWEFAGSPKPSFFSGNLGGAHRLPNGNTLACEGSSGRLFEVTKEGAIVWEYTNTHTFAFRDDAASPRIARARRYASDSPQLRGRVTKSP